MGRKMGSICKVKKTTKKKLKSYWIKYNKYGANDGISRLNNISIKARSEKEAFAKARKRIKAIDERTGSMAVKGSIRIVY